jgi:sugar/nucleoside kinase (ribokinase family)
MKTILTIGSATQDIFILYEGAESLHLRTKKGSRSFLLLEAGVKIDVDTLHYATGGGATNTAVSFHRLGLHALPCFKIGAGKAGEFVLERLKQEGLDLSYVIISPTVDTALSFIIPTPEKNYTALCYRGSHTQLQPEEIPFEVLTSCDYLYVTSLSGSAAELLPLVARKAKEHKVQVAANPGTKQIVSDRPALYEALKYLDVLILNAHEARLLMDTLLKQAAHFSPTPSPKDTSLPSLLRSFMPYESTSLTLFDYFKEVVKRGPHIAVVTDGAHGVYVGTQEKIYFHPSIPTQVLTAVGAGDAFGSTFVGALALGKSLEEAIVYGVVNASSVITYLDAKTGLLDLSDLEQKAQAIGTTQLFSLSL